jgi:hypothetical protein
MKSAPAARDDAADAPSSLAIDAMPRAPSGMKSKFAR